MSDRAVVRLAEPEVASRQAPRSALVSDALDALGLRSQCIVAGLEPLSQDAVLVGTAFTVRAESVDYLADPPYVGLLAALDAIGPGDVFVLDTAGIADAAAWGELCSTACIARGAVGAIIDGPVRDAQLVSELDFPVFARGRLPADAHGRFEIVAMCEAIRLGGVDIRPGDMIVGDCDGIVVVPVEFVDDVLGAAAHKDQQESLFRDAVARGMQPSDAFREYGVL